jgi:para-aminobenzoate synthetase component 1
MHTPEATMKDTTPAQALAWWPAGVPLAALWSARVPMRESRWTMLARPGERVAVASTGTAADVLGALPVPPRSAPRSAPRAALAPGWIVAIGYDAGRLIEPAVGPGRGGSPGDWPLLLAQRIDDALLHDNTTGAWSIIGRPPELAIGSGTAGTGESAPFRVGALTSDTGAAEYQRRVMRALEYIRAGDVYQVNLAHTLRASFTGSPRAFFASLASHASPWFGAYVEHAQGRERFAIASVSPELFLSFDPVTGRVETRPMKGTRAGVGSVSEAELLRSEKDAAELNMIVDLMRNDLGRACELGSIRVESARRIERHGALVQATAGVSGVLRKGAGLAELMRAVFPGGSITGAPKIRAMQIIDELETSRRGPWCGAIGFVADSGAFSFNIAIRTALIRGEAAAGDSIFGELTYPVGAGIVADSDPESEWRETLHKASPLLALTGQEGIE